MECKHCGSTHLRRMPRTGFFQNKVFPQFSYYPWECVNCREILMLKARGKSRRRSADGAQQPEVRKQPHVVQRPRSMQQPQS